MKNTIVILITFFLFISCSNDKKSTTSNKKTIVKTLSKKDSKGYQLMKNNCFVCHTEKPDPSKKEQMIAPPMLRVQEHYKPNYPNKKEFVNAIKKWVTNPTEEKVLMPGAVRKFNIMPKLEINEADIELVAATLYDIDFGNLPTMKPKKASKLTLNKGEKWVLNKKSKATINLINKQLINFKSNEIKEFNQLGKEVFNNAKNILLDKSYDEKTFHQIQIFFHNIEGNMHQLIATKTIETAKKEQQILIDKFKKFNHFFK